MLYLISFFSKINYFLYLWLFFVFTSFFMFAYLKRITLYFWMLILVDIFLWFKFFRWSKRGEVYQDRRVCKLWYLLFWEDNFLRIKVYFRSWIRRLIWYHTCRHYIFKDFWRFSWYFWDNVVGWVVNDGTGIRQDAMKFNKFWDLMITFFDFRVDHSIYWACCWFRVWVCLFSVWLDGFEAIILFYNFEWDINFYLVDHLR